MLHTLAIRDYAIIRELELQLGAGLTVLTGETGAGKSIIVDALGLVLGDRADTGAVRHGAQNAEITADFLLSGREDVGAWLEEHDLADGDACILRRVIGADGRSRAYINGRPAPLGLMRDLGERLVDIHGQHEHQSLLRRDAQLALLDAQVTPTTMHHAVATAFVAWQQADEAYQRLSTAASDRSARLELLSFQVRELAALGLVEGEIDTLEGEHARLSNSGRLLEAAQRALLLSDGEEEVHARALLHQATHALEDVAALDPALSQVHAMLNQALVNLGEGADDLRRWLDRFDLDPERKAWVEHRIGTAHQLARKHRVSPGELPALHAALAAELDDLESVDDRLTILGRARDETAQNYQRHAEALHKARTKAAGSLSSKVTAAMQGLGMPGGCFEVVVEHSRDRFHRDGGDSVEFLVAANPGLPPRPLVKTASGGELSRISLAIQVIAAHSDTIECLIFDEVDAGVGGAVAEIVGKRLRELSEGRQVLCVTHLPQVAAHGHQHLRISKSAKGGTTSTQVEGVEHDARIEELARMLGGVTVTEATRTTAQEMLENAS